jgi:transposase
VADDAEEAVVRGKGQKRLLHVSEGRTKESLKEFFVTLGQERSEQVEFACSDMWQPYLDVIDRYTLAVNILDRFHILGKFSAAIDEIRRAEMKMAKAAEYEQVLKHSRWCLLKNNGQEAGGQTQGVVELQPAPGKGVFAQRGFQAVLDVQDEAVCGDSWSSGARG